MRTPPTSVLWEICGETSFSATGKPMRAAMSAAPWGVAPKPLAGGVRPWDAKASPSCATSSALPRGAASSSIWRPARSP